MALNINVDPPFDWHFCVLLRIQKKRQKGERFCGKNVHYRLVIKKQIRT